MDLFVKSPANRGLYGLSYWILPPLTGWNSSIRYLLAETIVKVATQNCGISTAIYSILPTRDSLKAFQKLYKGPKTQLPGKGINVFLYIVNYSRTGLYSVRNKQYLYITCNKMTGHQYA